MKDMVEQIYDELNAQVIRMLEHARKQADRIAELERENSSLQYELNVALSSGTVSCPAAPAVATSENDERDNEIFELQKALAFWMPQVNQYMSQEMSQRIAHDAYMLVIDGNLPNDFKTAQEIGWILPATGKVKERSGMVCGNCMEPIAASMAATPEQEKK